MSWKRLAPWAHAAAWATLAGTIVAQGWDALHANFVDLDCYRDITTPVWNGTFWTDPIWNTSTPFFQLFLTPIIWLYQWVPAKFDRLAIVYPWNLFLSFAFVIVALRGLLGPGRKIPLWAIPLAWLPCSLFLNSNFNYHQINLLPATLAALAFLFLDRRTLDWGAGLLLGMAAAIKVTPALLLPYFGKRWRAWVAACTVGAVTSVLPIVALGPKKLVEAWKFWAFVSVPAQSGARGFANVGFPGLMHRFFDFHDKTLQPEMKVGIVDLGPKAAETLGGLLGWGLLIGLFVLVKRGRKRPAMLDLALLAPATNLASTVCWRHHLVSLIPAYAALALYLFGARAEPRRKRVVWLLFGAGLVCNFVQDLGVFPGLATFGLSVNLLGCITYAALFTILALAIARQDPLTDAWGAAPGEAAEEKPATAVPAAA